MAQSLEQSVPEDVQTTCDQYRYQPLPDSSIRLLEILVDLDSGVAQFRLHIHRIDECPPYTALSYMWGPEKPQRKIVVDETPFRIRANLISFLSMAIKKHGPTRQSPPLY